MAASATSRAVSTAMLCAAAVTAQFVGGKATRDALFLTSLDVTALPAMLAATSLFSILLVIGHGRVSRHLAPKVLVPALFAASGVLFVGEWLLRATAPSATAILLYLHVSAAAPILVSGVWLIATECFNPRTAKKGFGRIAAAGTLGGLCGALLSERVAVHSGIPTMLLVLAGLQFVTAGLVRRFAVIACSKGAAAAYDAQLDPSLETRSGLRVIAQAPHLRNVVALVLLGTTSAALLDYVFKVRAVDTFGPGDGLLRFFALYYAGTSLIAFVLQMAGSRAILERFGLGLTTSTPSIALVAGSIGGLIAPGFGSLVVARAGESIFRGSWFRAGYELFYTPIAASEKRAAKSIIDVGVDRLGDAVGGGLVRIVTLLLPAVQAPAILTIAIVSSLGAIAAASRLNRWYLRTLERDLVNRAGGIELSEEADGSTAMVIQARQMPDTTPDTEAETVATGTVTPLPRDPLVRDIMALRSRDIDRVTQVLSRDNGLEPALVPHVIPLLASDPLANHALFALRKVAEERVGELTDGLLDPNQDLIVRRRLARVFSVCVSQRAVDGLMAALDDSRFDVRFQVARSLAAIFDRNPLVHFDPDRIFDVVLKEVAVSRPVWESQRLLDGFVGESPLDAFVRDRAGQSLAHVFTLLSLVLPREPLQIAFRSLSRDDMHLRGTALEYLEGVLPPAVRQRLWPFLVYRPVHEPVLKEDVIANLLRSSESETLQDLAGWEKRRVADLSHTTLH